MRPETSLIVCTLPRSGSYMLCDGLAQTRRLGAPAEYFSAAHRIFYERLIGAEKSRNQDIVLDYILRMGMTPTGVFSAKILFHQLITLRQNYNRSGLYPGEPPLTLLDRLLPRPHYVHLIRRDKLRQAISYHRAIGSGHWWHQESDAPRASLPEVRYDFVAISRWLHAMTTWEDAWRRMLEHVNGPVLTLYYDEVVRDYADSLARVHVLMGMPPGPELALIRPSLKRQSDGTTEDWARRFTEAMALQARLPVPQPA